ncbi:polyphosphate kinase 2 [Poseidonibacter antarcticus]|uniref:polyphosphate kinase 2 n=1 Tax=Poseidonibacter antarcticus TaxID=2478538 RepID=UPI000EF50C9D|nr:polyphosphate kinase 2 [Poseidonibacter antarcticus]
MKNKKTYKKELYDLQVELVKYQSYVIKKQLKVCLLFEGRDTAGKDGTIKRFTEHLSPREARVVALNKPSNRDTKSWYFQRYVPHLPEDGEIVFFNRSWYNRAGVEKVMGFCTQEQYVRFMQEVGSFEHLLTHSQIHFFKYYLDISKNAQKQRLASRRKDPLKQWKISPIDNKAQSMWNDYSKARDAMFSKTSFIYAPWYIVHTDCKKKARINVIKHFLSHVEYPNKDEEKLIYDTNIVFKFNVKYYEQDLITK